MSCIDLRPICKERRWRWRFEPSYKADHMSSVNLDAPWYVEVPCINGLIYPVGDDNLLACIEEHPRMISKLRNLGPEVVHHQGDVVFRFPLRLIDAVAGVMKPRRKRPAPNHDAGIRALISYHNSQGHFTTVESTQTDRARPTNQKRICDDTGGIK